MRHKPNSTVYQEHYHNAMMHAVVQDAFLNRGTASPYLAILNHMGLRLDENAPKRVSDEMMREIGPSATVRKLEKQMEALQTELQQKYGRPSRAMDLDKQRYERLQAKLSRARQRHRKKVFRLIYAEHFVQDDEDELQKQLQGIHEPVVRREVRHSLPERQALADILGDIDEDLSEEEIVKRKVEAINAMVAYAFLSDPVQRAPPEPRTETVPTPSSSEAVLPMPLPLGQPIAPVTVTDPDPAWGSLIAIAPKIPPESPPPPYSEVAPEGGGHLTISSGSSATAVPARRNSRYTRKRPDPCIFCGNEYTRTEALWDHLESHLKLAQGGPLACPRLECRGMVLESPGHFKAHAARVHGSSFRTKIKLVTSGQVSQEAGGSAATSPRPRIILVSGNKARLPSSAHPSPRPRIILVGS